MYLSNITHITIYWNHSHTTNRTMGNYRNDNLPPNSHVRLTDNRLV